MPQLSKYEDSAQAFLQAYPVGSVVTADAMLTWATHYGNGLAMDLLLDDPGKKLSAIRRHLNQGASSRNLAEEKRFYLIIEDPRRKTVRVERLAAHVNRQAEEAFGKSVTGALNPLRQSERAISDIKTEELEADEQQALEEQAEALIKTMQPLRMLFSEQVQTRWVAKLEAKGFTPDQARSLAEFLPTLQKYQKLLKVTTE
jgi:hypothetical protein